MIVYEDCIYALKDPRDGRVRYVGHTRRAEIRKRQHELLGSSELRRFGDTPYVKWKRELLDLGLRPEFLVIESGKGAGSNHREAYWIRFFNKKNQPLTNIVIPRYRWLAAWKKKRRYKGTASQGKINPVDVFDMRYFESADR